MLKNTIWELGYYLVVVLFGFLAPRFIILTYGSEVNGLSSTITQILNIILILQAGATTAAIYSLYKPISDNDYEEICRNIASAEKFFEKIAYIFGGLMLVVASVVPFLLKTELDNIEVVVAFVLMGISSFLDLYFTAKFRIVFTAYQEKFYISITTLIEMVIYYAIVFITIFCKFHFLFMYVGYFTASIIRIVLLKKICQKKHGDLETKKYKRDAAKIGGRNYALANEVSHSVVNSSITIILSFMYGLKETSVYSVYALVSQALNLVATSIYSSFGPSFGNLIASGDQENSAKVFSIFQYIYVMMNTFLMMCMLFLVVPFVNIYTSGADDIDYVNYLLATVLVFSGIFSAYRIPYNVLVSTCGYFKETWKQPVISAIVSIAISVGLGFVDYALIVVGPIVFYFLNFVYQHFRLKQLAPWLITNKAFTFLGISIVGIGLTIVLNRMIPFPSGIFCWIIMALVFALISLVYIVVASLLFSRKEIRSSLAYMRGLFNKRLKQ